jgi:hypothetical protein
VTTSFDHDELGASVATARPKTDPSLLLDHLDYRGCDDLTFGVLTCPDNVRVAFI